MPVNLIAANAIAPLVRLSNTANALLSHTLLKVAIGHDKKVTPIINNVVTTRMMIFLFIINSSFKLIDNYFTYYGV